MLPEKRIHNLLSLISRGGQEGFEEAAMLREVFLDLCLDETVLFEFEMRILFEPLVYVTKQKCSKVMKRQYSSEFKRLTFHINCFQDLYENWRGTKSKPHHAKEWEMKLLCHLELGSQFCGALAKTVMEDSFAIAAMPAFVVAACTHICILQAIESMQPSVEAHKTSVESKVQGYRDHLSRTFQKCLNERMAAVSSFKCNIFWVDKFKEDSFRKEIDVTTAKITEMKEQYTEHILDKLEDELPFDFDRVMNIWESYLYNIKKELGRGSEEESGDSDEEERVAIARVEPTDLGETEPRVAEGMQSSTTEETESLDYKERKLSDIEEGKPSNFMEAEPSDAKEESPSDAREGNPADVQEEGNPSAIGEVNSTDVKKGNLTDVRERKSL